MVVHGDAGQTVVIEIVVDDDVAGVCGSGEGREDTDAGAGSGKLGAVVE